MRSLDHPSCSEFLVELTKAEAWDFDPNKKEMSLFLTSHIWMAGTPLADAAFFKYLPACLTHKASFFYFLPTAFPVCLPQDCLIPFTLPI